MARIKKQDDIMADSVWHEIESILQDLVLIKNGLASEAFTKNALQHLETICETPEVMQELVCYSEKK